MSSIKLFPSSTDFSFKKKIEPPSRMAPTLILQRCIQRTSCNDVGNVALFFNPLDF